MTDLELEQMSRYLDLAEETLRNNQFQQSYRKIESEPNCRDSEAITFGDDEHLDDFMEAVQDFPQLLLLGFIVTWYSLVEQNFATCVKN